MEKVRSTKVRNEFSKYASDYQIYSIIQNIVSKKLVDGIESKPNIILELGSGSGQVISNIDWAFEYYKAIDFSDEMCALHPKGVNIDVVCADFDDVHFMNSLKNEQYDLVLSASALQWSIDLPRITRKLSTLSNQVEAALFTSDTFKTIQSITGIKSPILSLQHIKSGFEKNFICEFEIVDYFLEFDCKKNLFEYIKKSGVSGDGKRLPYRKAKELFCLYDKEYLEFQVVYVSGCK
ncbi:MAG: class I SAM-dependent methyltransferase [Candidatus Thiodiazotropha sp. (ex Lucinoma borealis)]|nr:class I SAM-dependent methyltransferase [Candidatus Thiodiazotropha sp. (ex Lucinoma borealis)]